MQQLKFVKQLSANDVGATGSHQAGILVPKSDLSVFPRLKKSVFNPECWIVAVDAHGELWEWRFVYFNGKLHSRGSRNEYRLTGVTPFLQSWHAKTGMTLEMIPRGRIIYSVRLS